MRDTIVQIRISKDLKTKSDRLFSSMGMRTSDAVRMFFYQVVNSHGIPFSLKTKNKKPATKSIEKVHSGTKSKSTIKKPVKKLGKILHKKK